MSDVIDDGSDREMYDRDLCIARAREAAAETALKPMGLCYNCEDPVALGELFCAGTGCNTDWEKRKAAEKRNGRGQ